jgi:hypothetical protein
VLTPPLDAEPARGISADDILFFSRRQRAHFHEFDRLRIADGTQGGGCACRTCGVTAFARFLHLGPAIMVPVS